MPATPRNILAVFVGGAIGTSLRWGVGEAVDTLGASSIVGLVIVNVVGSFALGWFAIGDTAKVHHVNALFAVGLLGSFTTFSAYAVMSVEFLEVGSLISGMMFAIGSVAVGFCAALVGRLVGERR